MANKMLRRLVVAILALAIVGLAGALVPALFTVPAAVPFLGGISFGGALTLAVAIFAAEWLTDQIKALR